MEYLARGCEVLIIAAAIYLVAFLTAVVFSGEVTTVVEAPPSRPLRPWTPPPPPEPYLHPARRRLLA